MERFQDLMLYGITNERRKKDKTFGIFVSFGLEILKELLHSGRRFLYPRIVAVGFGLHLRKKKGWLFDHEFA